MNFLPDSLSHGHNIMRPVSRCRSVCSLLSPSSVYGDGQPMEVISHATRHVRQTDQHQRPWGSEKSGTESEWWLTGRGWQAMRDCDAQLALEPYQFVLK